MKQKVKTDTVTVCEQYVCFTQTLDILIFDSSFPICVFFATTDYIENMDCDICTVTLNKSPNYTLFYFNVEHHDIPLLRIFLLYIFLFLKERKCFTFCVVMTLLSQQVSLFHLIQLIPSTLNAVIAVDPPQSCLIQTSVWFTATLLTSPVAGSSGRENKQFNGLPMILPPLHSRPSLRLLKENHVDSRLCSSSLR